MKEANKNYAIKIIIAMAIYAYTYKFALKSCTMGSDFSAHLNVAAWLPQSLRDGLVYPLWHMLVFVAYLAGQVVGPMPAAIAGAFVTGLVNAICYWIIVRIFEKNGVAYASLIGGACLFPTGVVLPWYFASGVFMGSPTIWHSPTNLMVKPFAIVAFVIIIGLCERIRQGKKLQRADLIKLGIIIFFSVLAKPSFFQGIVPALAVYIMVCLIKDRFQTFWEYFRFCLSFVPAFLLVMVQFVVSFYTGEEGEGIGIGWLVVAGEEYREKWPVLVFLAMAFPILYYLLNIKKVWKKTVSIISILYLLSSWLQYALLYEKGYQFAHGNFGWALALAYSVVWINTTRYFCLDWQQMGLDNRKEKVKNTVILTAWLAQVIIGFGYAYEILMIEGRWN